MVRFTEDVDLARAIQVVLGNLWDSGSPVAGATAADRELVAHTALRRIQSLPSRGKSVANIEVAVNDVAKGLVHAFESRDRPIGPLLEDYRSLARVILDAVASFRPSSDA